MTAKFQLPATLLPAQAEPMPYSRWCVAGLSPEDKKKIPLSAETGKGTDWNKPLEHVTGDKAWAKCADLPQMMTAKIPTQKIRALALANISRLTRPSPEVHRRAELEEIKATMRDVMFQVLYQCRPTVGSSCLFPRDKQGTLGRTAPIQINWAWDFASGKAGAQNDYTVGCCVALMNDGRYAVLDLFRGKPDFTTMKQLIFRKWYETWQTYHLYPQVFIEDASAGQQMLQEIENLNLREDTLLRPVPVQPTHNKEMRAEAIASAQNNGQVDLPADAVWKEDFIRELEEFPLSEHDDCVDAYTRRRRGSYAASVKPVSVLMQFPKTPCALGDRAPHVWPAP